MHVNVPILKKLTVKIDAFLLNFEAPSGDSGAKQPAWPGQGSSSMSQAQDVNALPKLLATGT